MPFGPHGPQVSPMPGGYAPAGHDYGGVLILGSVLRFVALLVILGAIIAIVWMILDHLRNHGGPSQALRELDLAYARGTVSREEYFARRGDLAALQAPPAPVAPQPVPAAAPPVAPAPQPPVPPAAEGGGPAASSAGEPPPSPRPRRPRGTPPE